MSKTSVISKPEKKTGLTALLLVQLLAEKSMSKTKRGCNHKLIHIVSVSSFGMYAVCVWFPTHTLMHRGIHAHAYAYQISCIYTHAHDYIQLYTSIQWRAHTQICSKICKPSVPRNSKALSPQTGLVTSWSSSKPVNQCVILGVAAVITGPWPLRFPGDSQPPSARWNVAPTVIAVLVPSC